MAAQRPIRLPRDVFRQRVREVRTRRGWSQQDLADQLAAVGSPMDRSTVVRIEIGKRPVSLEESLAITATLGVAFVDMLAPPDESVGRLKMTKSGAYRLTPPLTTQIAITGTLRASPRRVRDWLVGRSPLRRDRDRLFYAEAPQVPELEDVFTIARFVQDLQGYVLEATADQLGDDGRAEARNLIELMRSYLNRVRLTLEPEGKR